MVLASATAFRESYRSGAQPIYLVEVDLGPAAYLQVVGYASGAGDTVTITRTTMDSTSVVTLATLTEGVDFDAETDDETTAANIAAAINAYSVANLDDTSIAGYPLKVRAEAAGDTVVLAGDGYRMLAFASSDTSAWIAEPVRLPRTIRFVSGDKPFGVYQYPCSVIEVSGVSSSMDPVTREVSLGNVDITVKDDGVLREYMRRTYAWINRPVRVLAGYHGMSEDDFAPLAYGVIDDFRTEYGSITLQCIEPRKKTIEATYVGAMMNVHPIDALGELLRHSGADYSEANGFDRTGAEHTNTGHWGVSLAPGEYTVADLIDQLLKILGGTLTLNAETGDYEYRKLDTDASVDRHFTIDEISDFENVSNAKSGASRVVIVGATGAVLFSNEDEVASNQGNVREFVFDTDFLGGAHRVSYPVPKVTNSEGAPLTAGILLNSATTGITVSYAFANAFCGTRCQVNANRWASSVVYEPDDALSSTQVATLMIRSTIMSPVDSSNPSLGYEYIEMDDHEIGVEVGGWVTDDTVFQTYEPSAGLFTEPDSSDGKFTHYPEVSRFTIKSGGRGAHGTYETNALIFGGNMEVFDVTIALAVADRVLSRSSNGMPEVRFRVDLSNIDLELGDFVTFDHPLFLGFKLSGADSSAVWEVISIEPDILSDSPGVMLTLALVRTAHRRTLSAAPPPLWPPPRPPAPSELMTTNDGSDNYTTEDGELYYR